MLLVAAAVLVLDVSSGHCEPAVAEPSEPTREDCVAAVDKARKLAEALPEDDLSRYFAERHLLQAEMEAGNSEFDDCVEYAEKAEVEVTEHRHVLKPGETFERVPMPPRK
jgi:hypothetical protein